MVEVRQRDDLLRGVLHRARRGQPAGLCQPLDVGEVGGFVGHLKRGHHDPPARGAQPRHRPAHPRRASARGPQLLADAARARRSVPALRPCPTERCPTGLVSAGGARLGFGRPARRRWPPPEVCAAPAIRGGPPGPDGRLLRRAPSSRRTSSAVRTRAASISRIGTNAIHVPLGERPRPRRRATPPAIDNHVRLPGRRYSTLTLPGASPVGCAALTPVSAIGSTAGPIARQTLTPVTAAGAARPGP